MDEIRKIEYLNFIFNKIKIDLAKYKISTSDKNLINSLFQKLIHSDNLLQELYILSHINDFKNMGKYFIFILKKVEDNVISFENLSQNIDADTEFIENEILNYLSNPKLRENIQSTYEDCYYLENESSTTESYPDKDSIKDSDDIEYPEDDKEIMSFKKNYLELIQSESNEENNIAYALPTMENRPGDIKSLNQNELMEEDIEAVIEGQQTELEDKASHEETKDISEAQEKGDDGESTDEIRSKIELSQEIKDELNIFAEQQEKKIRDRKSIAEEDPAESEIMQQAPANIIFLEYENEIKEKNLLLHSHFDQMIDQLKNRSANNEERYSLIKEIINASTHLENESRKMSLEVISNIYQTVTLSFEKISDGKYDISESTLNLFKNGLSLVISLVKGDDYFGYKDILKSIENIRNVLLDEREKRESYLKKLVEKQEYERQLNTKYPDNIQRVKVTMIKRLVRDTEVKFNSLDLISGEYQIYEALRSLSASLNNFKEIVKLAKELGMHKLIQLAESSYVFVKFLQNYRINPVTIETKEIFGYIIYNFKLLVVGKTVEDIDLFISYLNDPVKIFSKAELKKT